MTHVRIELRKTDDVFLLGVQPPLEDIADELYDEMEHIETPQGPASELFFTEKPQVGGAYSELTLGGDVLSPLSEEQTWEVANKIADVLINHGCNVTISETIEPLESGGYMFGGRRFTVEEQKLDRWGITPEAARSYLQDRFNVRPEEIRAAGMTRHGSHDIETYTRIALSEDGLYLFEDIFRQVREEVDNEARNRGELVVMGADVTTTWRLEEFRSDAVDIRKNYMPKSQ